MQFLVGYDIADPKRLRLIALHWEQHALRLQKSLFLYEGTLEQLRLVMHDALQLLDVHCDRLQAWPLLQTSRIRRLEAGATMPGRVRLAVISPQQLLVLEEAAIQPLGDSTATFQAPRRPR